MHGTETKKLLLLFQLFLVCGVLENVVLFFFGCTVISLLSEASSKSTEQGKLIVVVSNLAKQEFLKCGGVLLLLVWPAAITLDNILQRSTRMNTSHKYLCRVL